MLLGRIAKLARRGRRQRLAINARELRFHGVRPAEQSGFHAARGAGRTETRLITGAATRTTNDGNVPGAQQHQESGVGVVCRAPADQRR